MCQGALSYCFIGDGLPELVHDLFPGTQPDIFSPPFDEEEDAPAEDEQIIDENGNYVRRNSQEKSVNEKLENMRKNTLKLTVNSKEFVGIVEPNFWGWIGLSYICFFFCC